MMNSDSALNLLNIGGMVKKIREKLSTSEKKTASIADMFHPYDRIRSLNMIRLPVDLFLQC